mmetsp:Transcript_36329/g.70573  ORF Transcript_36329/g.70573 Transcript_36329/m.70573 type:complete len:251 (+) Transcript_36329:331-1083(+)
MLTTPLLAPSEERARVAAAYASKSIPSSLRLFAFSFSFLPPPSFFFFFLVFFTFLVATPNSSRNFFCFFGFGIGSASLCVSVGTSSFRLVFFRFELPGFSEFSFFFFTFPVFLFFFATFSFICFDVFFSSVFSFTIGFESSTVVLKGFPLVLNVFKCSRFFIIVALMARRRLFPRSRTRSCLLSANVSGTSVIRLSFSRSSFSPCIIDRSGITRILLWDSDIFCRVSFANDIRSGSIFSIKFDDNTSVFS